MQAKNNSGSDNKVNFTSSQSNTNTNAEKQNINSSGFLIAVLKRTMDKAPTSPNDKAREDFTTEIIRRTMRARYIKFRLK